MGLLINQLGLLITCCPRIDIKLCTIFGGKDFELSIYDPKGSSTSKKVTCSSSLCAQLNQCLGTFSNCPYMVSYMSAQTSTSGILVEDVLQLTTEDGHPDSVEAYVTFG